jgi:hypothetical protein
MSALDMLPILLGQALGSESTSVTPVLRAFLAGQYAHDAEVRFKQIDLQSSLFDLFVDVPIAPLRSKSKDRLGVLRMMHSALARHLDSVDSRASHTTSALERDGYGLGAAGLVLNKIFQSNVRRLIIEGAPGQGKSTLVQYACQIHRAQLLGKSKDISGVDASHLTGGVRIPLKIELRDYAEWLSKRNPFEPGQEIQPSIWHRSLESFIAAFISHNSGGAAFSSDRLINLTANSPILLVLDGLDEVADIETRQMVVDEISKGLDRLEAAALDLQAVLTTRPSAFAESPGIRSNKWDTYELKSMTPDLIKEYGLKFVSARRLSTRDGNEVKQTLDDRLGQSHIRGLARNPMQLAILMNLIQARGASLPDKRTSLYDSYVETFFNRETDKSSIVRSHRELLMELHMYLAWLIHSESESGRGGGKITTEDLRIEVQRFLEANGHEIEILEDLFSGMVERIVALVSRVEGTFEFEVQPLREYFAARHLYNSAPYSPTGDESSGTKVERFEAMASRPYWLNVTRFYAGCYSKGELSSIVHSLKNMAVSDTFKYSSIPRELCLYLLSDWVFSQVPKLVPELISIACDPVGEAWLLSSQFGSRGRLMPDELPEKLGGKSLSRKFLDVIEDPSQNAKMVMASSILRKNATIGDLLGSWQDNRPEDSDSKGRRRHLKVGLYLRVLRDLPTSDLDSLLAGLELDTDLTNSLISAGHVDYLLNKDENHSVVLATVSNAGHPSSFRHIDSFLDLLSAITSPITYFSRFRYGERLGFTVFGPSSRYTVALRKGSPEHEAVVTQAEKLKLEDEACQLIAFLNSNSDHLKVSAWEELIIILERLGCNKKSIKMIAAIGAGACGPEDDGVDDVDFFDSAISSVRRFRYARLRAGQAAYWDELFKRASSAEELWDLSLMFCCWAGPKTLVKLIPKLDAIIEGMSKAEWSALSSICDHVIYSRSSRARYVQTLDAQTVGKTGLRTLRTIIYRTKLSMKSPIMTRLINGKSSELIVLQVVKNMLNESINASSDEEEWKQLLELDQAIFDLSNNSENDEWM